MEARNSGVEPSKCAVSTRAQLRGGHRRISLVYCIGFLSLPLFLWSGLSAVLAAAPAPGVIAARGRDVAQITPTLIITITVIPTGATPAPPITPTATLLPTATPIVTATPAPTGT